jgi:hypothetical protein
MIEEQPESGELSFGEKLLGLQGFSAERARRYRTELECLLVHRITTFERWSLGIAAVIIGASFSGGGLLMTFAKPRSPWNGFDEARLTFAVTCIATGLILGGWLLRIAIQGGYRRRLGDIIGLFVALILSAGWGFTFMSMAWNTSDAALRMKLLLVSVTLFAIMAASAIIAHFQRMHRRTQEKLLRIEYHIAQLMERSEA